MIRKRRRTPTPYISIHIFVVKFMDMVLLLMGAYVPFI
jgi:hypothetical protein